MSAVVSSAEVCRRTGATYRQLDYWMSHGIIPGPPGPGSGYRRTIPADLVEPIRAAVAVQNAVTKRGRGATGLHSSILAEIIRNPDGGRIELGDGVAITWTVDQRSAQAVA